MTQGNFNWFLHVMLFLHTVNVIKKRRAEDNTDEDDKEENDNDEDEDNSDGDE